MSGAGYTVSGGPQGLGGCVSALSRHLEVSELTPRGDGVVALALERGDTDWEALYKELAGAGCVAIARREGGAVRVLIARREAKPRLDIALILGAAVLVTLYISGVFYSNGAPPGSGGLAWSPWAYLAGLLVPLMIHELGHYVAMRRLGVPSSVPIPLPAPPYPWFLGTFGSVILMRWPPPTATSLALIGIAGPIAGYIAALPVAAWGLSHSALIPPSQAAGGQAAPLVPLSLILLGHIFAPRGEGLIVLSPAAFAGYIMFFVTFLNLMPIGQLDGGHVVRAALGEKGHIIVSNLFIVALIAAGLYYPQLGGFALIAILLYMLSRGRHPGPAMPEERLRASGQAAAILYAALLVLNMPIPQG